VTPPPVTYLTMDSLAEGVGASQVLSYAERLSERGVPMTLHTFEKLQPAPELQQRLSDRQVEWHPHPFGAFGARGGVARMLTGARAVRHACLVHARSDLAACSAMVAGVDTWLWDVRSLWSDQRVALDEMRANGLEHRLLRRIEGAAARRSTAVVTLTEAVIPVLEHRHGVSLQPRASVITTCVDCRRFEPSPLPPGDVVAMLAGTLNRYYDVPLMLRLIEKWQSRRAVSLEVLAPGRTPWDDDLSRVGALRSSASFAQMPSRIAATHVGLSVCRADAGVSLSASMPTKLGEFLASGRPVVVNIGLGDAGELVESHRAGVAIRPGDDLDRVLDDLDALLADPTTPQRCRWLAEAKFDLDHAADELVQIYERMIR